MRGAHEQDPATSAMVYPGHSKQSRSILGVGLHPSVLMQEVEQTEPHKTGSIPNIRDSIRFPLLLKLWSEKGMERQARPTTCNLRHVGDYFRFTGCQHLLVMQQGDTCKVAFHRLMNSTWDTMSTLFKTLMWQPPHAGGFLCSLIWLMQAVYHQCK